MFPSVLIAWNLFSIFFFCFALVCRIYYYYFYFLIKILIGVISSPSFSNKETCFASSWITSSFATFDVFSSSLSFSSNCWICSYATSRALVYFLVYSNCLILNSTLVSFNKSPISIISYLTSLSYNATLVSFLVAMFSQSLAVCKVSNSTLFCATCNSFHNFFSFAIRSFQSLWWFSWTFSTVASKVLNSFSHWCRTSSIPFKLCYSFMNALISLFLKSNSTLPFVMIFWWCFRPSLFSISITSLTIFSSFKIISYWVYDFMSCWCSCLIFFFVSFNNLL